MLGVGLRKTSFVDKDMQLTLFPENACFVSLDERHKQNRNIREELLRRPTDCRDIQEVKLEENGRL